LLRAGSTEKGMAGSGRSVQDVVARLTQSVEGGNFQERYEASCLACEYAENASKALELHRATHQCNQPEPSKPPQPFTISLRFVLLRPTGGDRRWQFMLLAVGGQGDSVQRMCRLSKLRIQGLDRPSIVTCDGQPRVWQEGEKRSVRRRAG
jgi:hypothetical protein